MRVDEGKLNQLDDESFLKLRRNGVLSLIYLSLATTAQWEKLRNMHMLTRDPAAFAAAAGGKDVEKIDLETEEEFILSFDEE